MYGDEALSHSQVFRWHTNFKNGGESVGNEPRSGRPDEARTENNVQPQIVRITWADHQPTFLPKSTQSAAKTSHWCPFVRSDIAKTWILHHNNIPCYHAFSVSRFLTSKNIAVLSQVPYSLDMPTCNVFYYLLVTPRTPVTYLKFKLTFSVHDLSLGYSGH